MTFMFGFVIMMMAQAPAGYYSPATGKSGANLKTALCNIIAEHIEREYNLIWEDFKQTDIRPDGKIWDMYSDLTNYTPSGTDQGSSANAENKGGYNREHSFPKGWFKQAAPMQTDLFHIVPTDVYVNNRRENYPLGETTGNKWQSHNGFSKLGTCTVAGYTGTVFEPNDEYKGDFARIYFYMATCYEDKIAGWESPMLAGNAYPAYTQWVIDMLLRWAEEDPVSKKEIDRNNAVYNIQKNRNPYVDYPGLEQYVWGTKTTTAFDPENYDGGGSVDPAPGFIAAPTFSPASGTVVPGTTITISTTTEGASIHYTLNGGQELTGVSPIHLTITSATTVSAYAILNDAKSATVTANYTLQPQPEEGNNVYELVTQTEDLLPGFQYLIISSNQGISVAMAEQKGDIRNWVDIITESNTITTETGRNGYPYAVLLSKAEETWTIKDVVTGKYLGLTSNGNKLHALAAAERDEAHWSITFSGDYAQISPKPYPARTIQYNSNAPRFACYSTTQNPVMLFRQSVVDGIDTPTSTSHSYTVYTISGRYVRTAQTQSDALRHLPAGIYIVNGRKILITPQ